MINSTILQERNTTRRRIFAYVSVPADSSSGLSFGPSSLKRRSAKRLAESSSAGFKIAFQGKWVGTDTGCDCLGIYCSRKGVDDNSLSKGGCNRNETLCGCDFVSSRASTVLSTVPGQDSVCIKRAPGLNFKELYLFMNEDGSCKSGHTICGDTGGVSKGVCVPTGTTCPINSIAFGTTNPDAGLYDQNVAGTGITAFYTRNPT
jgi:hypothetical protein